MRRQPLGRLPWLSAQCDRRVVVHTRDDHSIDGVLAESVADGLVLRSARYLDESPPVVMAGEVFVPQDQVAMIQLLTDEDDAGRLYVPRRRQPAEAAVADTGPWGEQVVRRWNE